MTNQRDFNDDDLGALGRVVKAIRADVPDDARWNAARERLLATLELASPALSTPVEPRRRGVVRRAMRWLPAAAAAVAVVVVLALWQFTGWNLKRGEFADGTSDPSAIHHSPSLNAKSVIPDPLADSPHPSPLPAGEGTAVGRVEQTYAVFVQPRNENRERPLGTGDVLRAGDRLRVAPQGGLQVRLDDGSQLWLTANTEAECVGTRSNDRPAWRLVQGEIQANITRGTEKFCIAMPGGGLRVLGTEFHVRVYPDNVLSTCEEGVGVQASPLPTNLRSVPGEGLGVRAFDSGSFSQEKPICRENLAMKNATSILRRAIVVLTVLSGSVALEANDQEKVVPEGKRAICVTGGSAEGTWTMSADAGTLGITGTVETVPQTEYIRKWVAERINQPGEVSRSEVLMQIPLYPAMLTRVVAVDVQTGKVRTMSDFVGAGIHVNPVGPGLAFVSISPILHWTQSVGGTGNPIANSTIALVDTRNGDKVTLQPLSEWSSLYSQISPDRRKIAFLGCKDKDHENYGLYVADLETLEPKLLLKGGMRTTPAWSPDSRWIAISKAQDYQNNHELVLIDTLDGSVKSTEMKGAGAVFSPDGKNVVYSGGFKRNGSWMKGVPTSGNLFIATVPDGKPEQLTQLPKGGALDPVFSPDGSYLAYVVRSQTGADEVGIHIYDMKTKKDSYTCKIEKESAQLCGPLQWVDDRSKLVSCYQRPSSDEKKSPELCVIQVEEQKGQNGQNDAWVMSNPTFELPNDAENEGVKSFAKHLYEVFEINSAAMTAAELHEFEKSKEEYLKACELIGSIGGDLTKSSGDNVEAVKLQPSDLQPYLEAFSKRAAETTTKEHAAEVVENNLKFFLNSPLGGYYSKYDQFPPAEKQSGENAAPSFAEWAENPSPETMQFQVNGIRGSDREKVHCWFVVPGDDPAKTATSYEVVRSGKDELVLRTPVLADGKRFEATYKVQKTGTYKDKEGVEHKYVRIGATVTEVK